ncbi:aspartyl protease family protein [Qipengyuania gelatinilytica]|uniref:Aspartyl protease family protein n=1 Tax=Qipengyuania gelatinilytica TaxID=2867231 RepID=A0ABX9A4L6_9SPHN|nr:aspartyl protease family protein [Qipengyuania gelatinilytica]QZD96160.1 aspartyl protease family protein [Qipengyuania gelatinilytica]
MIERSLLVAAGLLLCGNTPVPPTVQDKGEAEQAIASQDEAGTDSDIIDVGFDQDRYERMTVPVTISGKGPYRFFIDTGAQATVVTRKVTDELELVPTGRARLVAMGSSEIVDTIDIDQLEFADRSFSGITAPLLERKNIGADGILGLDSLQDLRVLIDFREDSMSIADARSSRGSTGYEIVVRARQRLGQMIITDARLNGVRTAVIIDTGAQNSLGNLALLNRLRARARETLTATDVNGAIVESELAMARRLVIGDMELTNVPIGFADSPAIEALGLSDRPALILGMGNLRMFERVAIDFASRRVLFDLPGTVRRQDLVAPGFMATRTKS